MKIWLVYICYERSQIQLVEHWELYQTGETLCRLWLAHIYTVMFVLLSLFCRCLGGFHEIANCNTIHHEAICALVGVHKFTSKLACQYQVGNLLYHIQMWNILTGLVSMSRHRLTDWILIWKTFNKYYHVSEVKEYESSLICFKNHFPNIFLVKKTTR